MSKSNVKKPMSIMDFFKKSKQTTTTTTIITKSEKTEKCPVCNAVVYIESQSLEVHVNTCLDAQSINSNEEEQEEQKEQIEENKPVLIEESKPPPVPANDSVSKKRKLPTLNQSASSSKSNNTNNNTNKRTKKPCPFYKWMKDTPFVVDAFNYGKIDNCSGYFLSHFHSDHYGGLTKSWSHGPIYCSQVTANLVKQELKVDARWLSPLPMDELVSITDSIQVALIDANHCPGSVLFLFVIGHRRHLHTGDFRANPRMCLHPLIKQPENPPISCLYLDTTYMNPMYAFPAQEECIQAVCEVLTKEIKIGVVKPSCLDTWIKKVVETKKSTTLVLVGTYKIGKEKVFINAAKALDSKIYVNSKKKQVLLCQENQELNDRLTDQPTKAQVHVVPLQDIRYDRLAAYLDQYKSHFSNIIAIKPTGWTFKPTQQSDMKQAALEDIIKPPSDKFTLAPNTSNAKIKIYSVPYSEHSSFRELASFIASLDIGSVLPTVNLSKTQEMHAMLDDWKYEKQAKKIEVVPFITEDHW